MEQKDEKYLILEQYRIYSNAKERFIDRQFATNKFYLIINVVLLVVAFALAVLVPEQIVPTVNTTLILSIIGIVITVMWLMSVDTYQTLIKVKYSKVLEYLETKLPEQPYNKEFSEYTALKKSKGLIVFGDMQKILTLSILFIYVIACTISVYNIIRFHVIV